MAFFVKEGKVGLGCKPADIPGELINRAAGASLLGEPLYCDISNTSYETDADEGGVYGNGISGVAGGVNTLDHLLAPAGVVTRAGIAVGKRVPVLYHGLARVLVTQNVGANTARMTLIQSGSSVRAVTGIVSNLSTNRVFGWTHANHVNANGGVATVNHELLLSTFLGLGGR